MAVPKRRTSKSKKNLRRAHHALKTPTTIRCSNCGNSLIPHRVCSNCGHYRGRNVLHLELTD